MGKKFYAVAVGKKTGIFDSWNECQEQINHFPKSKFKSFNSREEAENYLNNSVENLLSFSNELNEEDFEAVAYTDGSYDSTTKSFSYGLLFKYNNQELEFKEKFNDYKWSKMHNVAGEIMGAKKAMQLSLERGIKSLLICFDYKGIEKWCSGEWETNNGETNSYKAFYDEISQNVKISFKWIKGHSGNKNNERADKLAKEAFNLPEYSQVINEEKSRYIDKSEIITNLKEIMKSLGTSYKIINEKDTNDLVEIELEVADKKVIMKFNFKKLNNSTIAYEGDSIGYKIKTIFEEKYTLLETGKNNHFVLKSNNKNNIKKLLEDLKKDSNLKVEKEKVSSEFLEEVYNIKYKQFKVKCNIYKNDRILFQGKSSILFSIIFYKWSEINNNMSVDEIIEISNEMYGLQNSSSKIEDELKELMPSSYYKINEIIRNNLLQSLSSMKIKSQLYVYDYAQISFPALKALEGQIKQIFLKYNVIVPKNFVNIFNKNEFTSEIKTKINDKYQEKILMDMFQFFKDQRNTTFHLDQYIDSSRRIETLEEAKDIIYDVINKIEGSF